MLGKTNSVLVVSGGGGDNMQNYSVDFAYDYTKDLLDSSVNISNKKLLNILNISGNSSPLSGIWEYKPASLREYLQNILTCDNISACKILNKIISGYN